MESVVVNCNMKSKELSLLVKPVIRLKNQNKFITEITKSLGVAKLTIGNTLVTSVASKG